MRILKWTRKNKKPESGLWKSNQILEEWEATPVLAQWPWTSRGAAPVWSFVTPPSQWLFSDSR